MPTEFPPDDLLHPRGIILANQHYTRAPIAEAIISIEVAGGRDHPLTEFASILADEPSYLPAQPYFAVFGQVDFRDGVTVPRTSSSTEVAGLSFSRPDRRQIVQVSPAQYAFVTLPPYTFWGDFLTDAMASWRRYSTVRQAELITRLGVRFVNRIDVPKSVIELKDYLRTTVELSPYLPQAVRQLFLQATIPFGSSGVEVTISSAIAEPPRSGISSLLLDINATSVCNLQLDQQTSEEDLLAELRTLRAAKNYAFEACITDATRGLIE